jgi:hypothetical protein
MNTVISGEKNEERMFVWPFTITHLQFFLTGIDPRPRVLHTVLPETAPSRGYQCQRHSRRRLGSSADGSVKVMLISLLVVLFICAKDIELN